MKTHLSVSILRTFIFPNGMAACGANRGENRHLQARVALTTELKKVTCAHCQAFQRSHKLTRSATGVLNTLVRRVRRPKDPKRLQHLSAANELMKRVAARLKSARSPQRLIVLVERLRLLFK